MTTQVVGAVIDQGASDWQVFQQDDRGLADIAVSGRWGNIDTTGTVELRLVQETTNEPVAAHLNWTPAQTRPDGTWSGVLKDVPAGGLYRLETHRRLGGQAVEWSQRGDTRHLLGVGDLWIIAGQSNSAGYGRGPCYDPPELGVHVFNNAHRWALATQPMNDSTDTVHPANREAANSGQSPWLHWARLVKADMGFPIGLIQTSLGGSGLSPWYPAAPGQHPLFDVLVNSTAAAGRKVKGILWYQGESDNALVNSRTYEARFIAAVEAWRKALGNEGLHVLTVQIGRHLEIPQGEEPELGWTLIRQAQRAVTHRIPNVSVVPTLDLPLSDAIHISPYGNLLLAERAARMALGAVYGKEIEHLAPEPTGAHRDAAGKVVEITFANVVSRLECFDPHSVPFRVEDAQGVVPIEAVQYTGNNRVLLRLGRTLGAAAVVHGGYSRNPPTMPCDMVRLMPMLSFYGLDIES